MLKCSINNKGNTAELIHDCVCDKNVEEIGLALIDTLIYSEYVHDSAKYKDLSQREQDEIIQSIRNRLLDEMKKKSSMCQRDCSVINIITNI